jgi:hypothetical protein
MELQCDRILSLLDLSVCRHDTELQFYKFRNVTYTGTITPFYYCHPVDTITSVHLYDS